MWLTLLARTWPYLKSEYNVLESLSLSFLNSPPFPPEKLLKEDCNISTSKFGVEIKEIEVFDKINKCLKTVYCGQVLLLVTMED